MSFLCSLQVLKGAQTGRKWVQPHPIPFTPIPGAQLGSQATVGTPRNGSFGDLSNSRCPLEHKNLQESPSLSLELLSSSPNPDRVGGEASETAPPGRAERSRGMGKGSGTAWSSEVKNSGFAHKPQHPKMALALSWPLLVLTGGSKSGVVQGWERSFNPSQGTDWELPSPVVGKLKLLGSLQGTAPSLELAGHFSDGKLDIKSKMPCPNTGRSYKELVLKEKL